MVLKYGRPTSSQNQHPDHSNDLAGVHTDDQCQSKLSSISPKFFQNLISCQLFADGQRTGYREANFSVIHKEEGSTLDRPLIVQVSDCSIILERIADGQICTL